MAYLAALLVTKKKVLMTLTLGVSVLKFFLGTNENAK
jgi:hypothetical protein